MERPTEPAAESITELPSNSQTQPQARSKAQALAQSDSDSLEDSSSRATWKARLQKLESPPRLGAKKRLLTPLSAHCSTQSSECTVEPVSRWPDRLGVFLSGLCIVHCAVMPVVVLLAPTLNYFAKDEFHKALLMIIPLVALLAFIPGYLRHRSLKAALVGTLGFTLLSLAIWNPNWLFAPIFGSSSDPWSEPIVSIAGSLCLIWSHRHNAHLSATCTNPGHRHRH